MMTRYPAGHIELHEIPHTSKAADIPGRQSSYCLLPTITNLAVLPDQVIEAER